ncbi:MAG: hypothetical protein KF871_00480 [Hydrogenophaga sp.]|uniref:hypothetical protein n=1 Tax=Hydrogenophaga sp. TaxID=1904254 RepID=UPI001DB25768|nr:hypothetical protein [Hydrogenophaga sp.]MBX3608341.1 hypothetical protein [Hydrogenophaga sp.]
MIELEPSEALTQVVFVHDYIQLVFHGLTLSLYGTISVVSKDEQLERASSGFCDRLVGLIGQRATAATDLPENELNLRFESGVSIQVRAGDGPETWELHRAGLIVVGR